MTIDAPTYRRPLAGSEISGVLAGLEGGVLSERRSLENETDPFLYSESLLSLAGRQERAHHPEVASRFYSELLQSPETPASQRERAQQRLAALQGEGELGARAEVLFSRFVHEATDPSALFAMTVAGTVFRAARFVSLARLASHPVAGAFTRGWGARALSGTLAYAAEATVFPLALRLGRAAQGHAQDWNGESLGRELGSSFMMLGALRAGGLLARSLARPGSFLQPFAQQAGMFGGIVLSRELETWVGLRPESSGSIILLDSLATLLQFHVAGRLQQGLIGEGMRSWERSLDARSGALAARTSPPPDRGGILPEMAVAGPADRFQSAETPLRNDRVYMTKGGSGGESGLLIRAASLRVRITPEEAWTRRESSAQDYLKLLQKLPNGTRSTIDEANLGIQMFGEWAESPNHFLSGIGHRYYAEAWQVLRTKYSHVNSHYGFEMDLLENVSSFERMAARNNNPRLLRQAIGAAPSIVNVIHYARFGLVEGSPRDLALLEGIRRVLGTLRRGAAVEHDSPTRGEFLETWIRALYEIQATGEVAARDTVAGIKLLERDLSLRAHQRLGAEKQGGDLALEYFPQFWELFRNITRVNESLRSVDLGVADRIAFLQIAKNIQNPNPDIQMVVLKAYPFYVESQIALHSHHPAQLSFMVDAFVGISQSLRTSIALARGPQLRGHYVDAYIKVLSSCRLAMLELGGWQMNWFPRNVPLSVHQEISHGLVILRDRFTSESGEMQIRAMDQYWQLAKDYPIQFGIADRLSSESNLKYLSILAGTGADPRLREAAQDLLQKILDRFRPNAPRH